MTAEAMRAAADAMEAGGEEGAGRATTTTGLRREPARAQCEAVPSA